jgi:hypothetical protein
VRPASPRYPGCQSDGLATDGAEPESVPAAWSATSFKGRGPDIADRIAEEDPARSALSRV